jgi:hypothetical protein
MVFYYYSFFGVLLILAVYALGGALLGALWFALRKWKRVWILMLPLFSLLLILPWAEELWIAWNFGRMCKKDAGVFVYKTVRVEGFYDAHMRSGYENIESGGYHFMEHPSPDGTKVEHVEKIDGEWRVTLREQPTARYRYTRDSVVRMSHKVWRQVSSVDDLIAGEQLGKYTRYSREAPWFFIGLSRPSIACDGPEGGPYTKHSFLIYRDILKPAILDGKTFSEEASFERSGPRSIMPGSTRSENSRGGTRITLRTASIPRLALNVFEVAGNI